MIVNEIFSLSSLSDSPLLVYINSTDFYVSLLCPVMLLNTFITSNSFFHGDFSCDQLERGFAAGLFTLIIPEIKNTWANDF